MAYEEATEKIMCGKKEKEDVLLVLEAIRDVRKNTGKGKIFVEVTMDRVEVEAESKKKYKYP